MENREVLEIVRSQEDVLVAHHRVSGMNFIPGGHVVPASVRDARGEVESQLIEGAPAKMDMQPLSPNPNNKIQEDVDDEDEPSTPRMNVIPSSLNRHAMPLPQLQTPFASNPASTYSRKSKSLQINIQEPPNDELVRRVIEAFNTPLPSSSGASSIQKRRIVSSSAPTQEDLPQEELLPPRERRTKMKHDKWPRKNREVSWAKFLVRGCLKNQQSKTHVHFY